MPLTKNFCFQLLLDTDEQRSSRRPEEIRTIITSMSGRIFDEALRNNDGEYLNILVHTDNPSDFLCKINDKLDAEPNISRSLVIVCEGSNGWDNYLLLRHYEWDEEPDTPP